MSCNVCMRPWTKGVKWIVCCFCLQRVHISCTGLSTSDYIAYSNTKDCICRYCNSSIFPFNHIDDCSLYEVCVNSSYLPDRINIDKLAKLNSNPFTLLKSDNLHDDCDLDPDINFLNCLTTVRNEYYLDDRLSLAIAEKGFSSNVKLLHLNIRSLAKNSDALFNYLSNITAKFHFIALTETWTKRIKWRTC